MAIVLRGSRSEKIIEVWLNKEGRSWVDVNLNIIIEDITKIIKLKMAWVL